jgi:Putative peptidoglycan binding domain
MIRRFLIRIALVLAVVISATLPTLSPAYANGYYPSGCHHYAAGYKPNGWDANCWLAENGTKYINHAVYVLGTQIILKGFGYYTITIDTWFGTGTYTGVRLYQNHEGISSDGIVGKNTFHHLLGELAFYGYNCDQFGRCWYIYSSPGTIGTARWHMEDDVTVIWSVIWNGWQMEYGSEPAGWE